MRIELESGSGLPSVSSPQASVENEKEGYYACARWLNLQLNDTLALLHFACVIFAMLALFWQVLAAKKAIEAMWHAQDSGDVGTNVVVPVLALLLGCALFGVNIIWALIVRLRKA